MGLKPLATIVTNVHFAMNASRMPEAPGYGMLMALKKAGLTLDDMKVMEINEAFACVPLVSLRILAGGDNEKAKLARAQREDQCQRQRHRYRPSQYRFRRQNHHEPDVRTERRGGGYAMGSLCGGLAQSNTCIIKVD